MDSKLQELEQESVSGTTWQNNHLPVSEFNFNSTKTPSISLNPVSNGGKRSTNLAVVKMKISRPISKGFLQKIMTV